MKNRRLTINIVGGTGIMGKVHKQIFEKAGHKVLLTGRKTKLTPKKAAKISDVTIISVPIKVTKRTIKKIAPYCKAIMDFTSLKEEPLKTMLEYSNPNAEVAGLHPLYGEVKSIKGRTIILCKTRRTGKICLEVINALKKAGAEITSMGAREHDTIINNILQNARIQMLEAYGLILSKAGIDFDLAYRLSTPQTKIILDVLSRLVDEKSDDLYAEMRKANKSNKAMIKDLIRSLIKTEKNPKQTREKIRALFGKNLVKAQERVKKIIDLQTKDY